MNRTAKVLLVLLRIAIGWHFLYEGVFKLSHDGDGDELTSSRPFLQASVGRLREAMTAGDVTRIAQWPDEVAAYFRARNNPLAEDQKAKLAALSQTIALAVMAEGGELPNLDWATVHEQTLQLAGAQQGAHFSSEPFLRAATGPSRGLYRWLIRDSDRRNELTQAHLRDALDRRYSVLLAHYRFSAEQQAKLARARDEIDNSVSSIMKSDNYSARAGLYYRLLDREREASRHTGMPFEQERLQALRKDLDLFGDELTAVPREALVDLAARAQLIATPAQLAAGPAPRPGTRTALPDALVKWSLVAIGLALLLGLASQPAAMAAIGLLAMFYFAAPPWPGLPELSGEGHYLFINRNLIEALACGVLAALPTGVWAGLDAWIAAWRKPVPVPAAELAHV